MQLFAFLILFLGVLDFTSAECSMTNATVECLDHLGQGKNLAEAVQIYRPLEDVNLHVGIANVTYGWLNLTRRMFNGSITGPTFIVRPGDTLNVNLVNALSAEGNEVNHLNTTNLHTHGLHISSVDPQDNVLVRTKPGETHEYGYQIHPQNAPGTNWYHAHVHGTTMFHVSSGLSGFLIVEDDVGAMPKELADVSCPDHCDKDIQMLFQGHLLYGGFEGFGSVQNSMNDYEGFKNDQYILVQGGTLAEFLASNLHLFTTNGLLEPNQKMETGQMYRFRMGNAGARNILELYIVDANDLPTTACAIREIALDGVYLNSPRPLHDKQSLLVPGGRVDWMIKCNVPGTYYVKSFGYTIQLPSVGRIDRYEGNLVKLTVSGAPTLPIQRFPSTLPERPSYMNDLRSLNQSEIQGRFVVELSPRSHLNREHWIEPVSYRYKMPVGTIQEWNILNADGNFSHPLHIHVNHFQIISYNEYTGPYATWEADWQFKDVKDRSTCLYQRDTGQNRSSGMNTRAIEPPQDIDFLGDPLQYLGHEIRYSINGGNTLGYARVGDWRDVILVPPLANITIRFMAHEHIGDLIMHCHILNHEDAGMMMVVEVVAEGESTEANIPSGNAYPGSCRACDRYPFNNAETLGDCQPAVTTLSPDKLL